MLIVTWDECCCETNTIVPEEDGIIPADSSDTDVIAYLRGILDAATDDNPQDGWRMAGIARTPATATIEWRSDRNHLAVTTVIWDD